MRKIRAAIIGSTGYTGIELLRILSSHPTVEIITVTSRSEKGRYVGELFPSLRDRCEVKYSDPEGFRGDSCDIVFFAAPNGVAMQYAPDLLKAGVRIIDLSADFRIKDQFLWEKWYGMTHLCPHLLKEAVYGLTETNREHIRSAQLIANPGCYPTAVQLGYIPLLEKNLVDTGSLIADAKSGVSGAGRKASLHTAMCEVNESFKAYNASAHRHQPEIKQQLELVTGGDVTLTFTPHLVPMSRGIFATLYAKLLDGSISNESLQAVFEQRYIDEPFVDVLPFSAHPQTISVRGTNHCHIAVHRPYDGDTVVVLSVEDNLVKGAAGQAVQNMNLMCGLSETCGLDYIPLFP